MPSLADAPPWFMIGVAVCLGLAFGSFLNVVIYRLPREQSLVSPPSQCPSCGEPIRPWHNIPVLGWLLLGGKAACCKTKINPRYPLVEAGGGLLAWAIVGTKVMALPSDTSLLTALGVFALYLALVLGLVAVAFIDLEHMLVPDSITLSGTLLGVATATFRGDVSLWEAVTGALVGFLMIWLPFDVLYRLVRGRTGMALGDAKLVMLAGAWFGIPGALFCLMAGAVQGTIAALVVYLTQGSIEEPEAVRQERDAVKRALEEASEEERAALEEELKLDPLHEPAAPGLMGARLAFGAFLALATLEYLFFGDLVWHLLLGPGYLR